MSLKTSTKESSVALILFAKEPIQGQVKTRLGREIGAQQACQLYEQMLYLQLRRFSHFPGCHFCFYISPDKHSPFVQRIKKQFTIVVEQQQGADLGERMYNAFQDLLSGFEKVILFGADCPFLDKQVMLSAIDALDLYPLVFNPAEDGGYMLIGARKIDKRVFQGIDWSTEQVMQQTRKQIDSLGWVHYELPALADIDRSEDLSLLQNTPICLP